MNLSVTIVDSVAGADNAQRQATIRRAVSEKLSLKERVQHFDHDRRIPAHWGPLPGRAPFNAPNSS